jgi:ribosomal-protein-alanine N-acetyltransferase
VSSVAIRLRPMEEADIPAVVALEEASQFTPWSAGNFRDALTAGNLCILAECGGRIAASAVLQLAGGDAELLSMAVLPAMRRQGMARRMLGELIARAAAYGAGSIWLEVRASNRPAIALYAGAGFIEVGRRKEYYRSATGREDALVMRLVLNLLLED